MRPGRRDIGALRKWVRDLRVRAKVKADQKLMGGSWVFNYREKEDEEPINITEEQFFGEEGSGHPQPGWYDAAVYDDDGVLIEENNGMFIGDVTRSESETGAEDPMTTLAGQMSSLAKTARMTLEQSASAEARAHRRAEQAEAREKKIRDELDTTLDAMNDLRQRESVALIARDKAINDLALAEAAKAALQSDYEELQRRGGELAEAAPAFVRRIYEKACAHFGEDPIASEREAVDEASFSIVGYLLSTYLALPDGRQAMLALALHHQYDLPWRALRVVFYDAWGVDMESAPPLDWTPPQKSEDEPAAQEIH